MHAIGLAPIHAGAQELDEHLPSAQKRLLTVLQRAAIRQPLLQERENELLEVILPQVFTRACEAAPSQHAPIPPITVDGLP